MTLLFSVEVCLRLYRETKREPDPDLDNLANPHEVKHWMDPKIIPYGWGLFGEEEDEVIVIEKGEEEKTSFILGLLWGTSRLCYHSPQHAYFVSLIPCSSLRSHS